MRNVVIATRESALALWQAKHVQARLQAIRPEWTVSLLGMTTKGDILLDSPLSKIGGKGLFVKELEVAMMEKKADLAVHSMKDVPMKLPEGFALSAILERERPTDAFVSNHFKHIDDLPENAVVGTSSLRRQAQLLSRRPDLKIRSLRGNVQTRLRKLDDGEFDGIVLATAGLMRLELHDRIRHEIDEHWLLPACGQGAVGIESREDDHELNTALQELAHLETTVCVLAERAMNSYLNGGCQVPIAGYCVIKDGTLHMEGRVASEDGTEVIAHQAVGSIDESTQLGESIAQTMLAQGAGKLLEALNQE
ncbi:MAG: hydroxymethylbilane synthase [Gammaproteobacteria bacterium]|nr:hydroxymethylbilane synthase [Gammaproteobacteria bacterium]